MSRTQTDIFISGGGIAGLTAGIALARNGFSVILADPSPPPDDTRSVEVDLRSTAFLQPARELLDETGLWGELAGSAEPLDALRVIDLTGAPHAISTERTFQASDLGDTAFGWNLPNALTRKVLYRSALGTPGLDLRMGTGFASLLTREQEALISLSDGTRIAARLAVAADGRASPLREAAGISVEITRYGQKALAFAVRHDLPHRNVSTELYHKGGAFVLVPLPDADGLPASAVVWMHDGPKAKALADLDDAAFGDAATERSAGVLGQLTPITPRAVWPVVTQFARRLSSERVALIAEAAHVFPPIGAQGLNTSLTDVRALLDAAIARPDTLGNTDFLHAYARRRERDVATRARVIDFYNRLCRSGGEPASAIRSLGLKMVHDVAPVRNRVMAAGMGG